MKTKNAEDENLKYLYVCVIHENTPTTLLNAYILLLNFT